MRVPPTAAVSIAAILSLFSAAVYGLGSAGFNPPPSPFPLSPNVSFSSVSGGRGFLCGLRSGGRSLLCWNSPGNSSVKRVYNGDAVAGLSVGDDQIAAEKGNGTGIKFWRGDRTFPPDVNGSFRSLTSGRGFSCAIDEDSIVQCWGSRGDRIQMAYMNISMSSIAAGDSHVCGITTGGGLICKGSNESRQLNAPASSPFEFSNLALGVNHSCAIRQATGAVLCWGGGGGNDTFAPVGNTSMEFIVAGGDRTCGVLSANLSVICWASNRDDLELTVVPLPNVLPGILRPLDRARAVPSMDTNSQSLCSGTGFICKPCNQLPLPSPPPPPPPPPSTLQTPRKKSKWNYVFVIIGAVGGFIGVCSVIYWLFFCVCRREKVHNSVQPTIGARNGGAPNAAAASPYTSPSGSRSSIFIRQASRVMRRQRSGPSSSMKERAELFTLAELAVATKNFSPENKIGAGSFGQVYKGELPDGREVAIKRSDTGTKAKKFQEKESAFQSELAFLSRLNHKHLVGLIGS
ncbi:hypothetical protein J5N97_013731 [Dioscorea zingiberensis]|uniref:non-specific serine/threonine protein kinase n=1 Tax=Dioscorea zingiberensis TaxID=325984 RepID=A0A9D5HJC9_9LILI|nr:hypothetical protein J5N97_013731 [Dioscorea zingiberensis]